MEQPMHPDVIWHTPSTDEHGSMPLGNGEVGVNLWTEHGRDLCAYVTRTDAWDENQRLCKLARLRIRLPAGSFAADAPFVQRLDLACATVRIRTGDFSIDAWVDAAHPVLRLAISGREAFPIAVSVELWRCARTIRDNDEIFAFARHEAPFETVSEHADDILTPAGAAIAWCHHNRESMWANNLELQHLGDWARTHADEDPLLHRTFGALVDGEGLIRSGPLALSGAGHTRYTVALSSACVRCDHAADLLPIMERQHAALPTYAAAEAPHVAWWQAFWARSWIRVSGDAAAEAVSRGYALQRYLFACAGRGRYPIKFNGSLFTVSGISDGFVSPDGTKQRRDWGPDWRRWGGCYWFQNTRLAYWPMIMSGDTEMAEPLFRMYQDCLPLARARTAAHHGTPGVVMPETITIWGTWGNVDYGYPDDRAAWLAGKPRRGDYHPPSGPDDRHAICGYLRRHFSGALELVALGLDLYATSGDQAFLSDRVLPLAREYLAFYRAYYQRRGPDGKLLLWPSQSLETWQDTTDPLPEIAALRWVIGGLLALPAGTLGAAESADWSVWLAELPELPTRLHGERFLIPAKSYDLNLNCENPELYAVFPFRFYGVGKPGLDVGRATWKRRLNQQSAESWIKGGWFQDPIQAAMLGLGQEAKRLVTLNATTSDTGSRFPAFWGPNFDWVPDQDHGGVLMLALQRMVMQAEAGRIDLLPAWPAGWNVDFRLHAPGQRVVTGEFSEGAWQRLEISGEADQVVERHAPQSP